VKLSDIIGQDGQVDARFAARDITGIAADSRKVKPGYLFVAVPGTKADGLSFVPQALAAGATAILAERAPDSLPEGVAIVVAKNVRRALALAAARFYPRQPKTIAAVTGTSGKTSVAAFTRQIWAALGEAAASHLHALANGRDSRRVDPVHVEKSISAETTFDVDIDDPAKIRRTLLALSNRVATRLRQSEVAGRTIAIKVRLSDFRTLNRSRTLHSPTDVAKEIFDTSIALFEALRPGDRIRLLGVRAEGLVNSDGMPRQAALGDRERGWSELERAADAATARFGRSAVRPASLLGSDDAGHQRGAGDTDGERVDWFQMPGPWNSPE